MVAGNDLDQQALVSTGVPSVPAAGDGALRVVLFHEEKMCCSFRERSCYLTWPSSARVHLHQPIGVVWHAGGKSICACWCITAFN